MNAIVRHPAIGAAADLRGAEAVVASMATIIHNAVENRGACLDADLERAGYTADEIREYGPTARKRVAPLLVRAGLAEDLTDLPEPPQADQFADPPPFALPVRVVQGRGCWLLEAADGEVIIRETRMSTARRARLDWMAAACNLGGGL